MAEGGAANWPLVYWPGTESPRGAEDTGICKRLARECFVTAVQGGGLAGSLPRIRKCAYERASRWHLPAKGTCHILVRLCHVSSNTCPLTLTQRSHPRKGWSEKQTTLHSLHYRISSQGTVPWGAGRSIELDSRLIKLNKDFFLIWTGPEFLVPEKIGLNYRNETILVADREGQAKKLCD